MANVTISNTYIMTFPAGSTVTVNLPTFGCTGSNSYCVEFFVKFDTLPSNSTLVSIGNSNAQGLQWQTNTSITQIASSGYAIKGSVNALATGGMANNVAFLANTWYHFAYMGISSNTYMAINGRVYNLNTPGGDGPGADGQWNAGSFPTLGNFSATSASANVYISNFRHVSNGTVYSLDGFTPPNAQLTAISNTRVLLANSTFRNEANNTVLTTTGTPSIATGDVTYTYPLMTGVTLPNTVPTQYANATSDSAIEDYIVRSRGSGANQIAKVIETIPRAITTTDANTDLNFIVRSRGSGANQIAKVIETIPRAITTSDANTDLNFIVRSIGSGANQIIKQIKTVSRVYYDKDGRIINQFTWG